MGSVTLSTAQWTPIGPAPIDTQGGLDEISGRVQTAAPDPIDPTTIYAGGDNGGIWKTTTRADLARMESEGIPFGRIV